MDMGSGVPGDMKSICGGAFQKQLRGKGLICVVVHDRKIQISISQT